ncbi:MAG: DHH family phosphoesterase [Candidatus Micrarchaeia archaeon]
MRILDFNELLAFFKSNSSKKFLFTFHSIGDRDAVSSAVAFSNCFQNVRIGTPDFITNNARQMLREVGYNERIEVASLEGIEAVVVFDANNLESLGAFGEELRSFRGSVLFIDHHLPTNGTLPNNFFLFSDESYNSTASIIYDLILRLGMKVDSSMAILLLNGIISDSAEFRNATAHTFAQIGELLGIANISYAEIMEYFHKSIPLNNRYSTITDLYNSKVELVGDYILIYGRAEQHANIAADMAIKIGADASLFWMVSEKEASISARLRPPLDKKHSIHLGRIMQHISKLLDGNGGGHPCAAGAYGPKKEGINEAVSEAVAEIRNALKQ